MKDKNLMSGYFDLALKRPIGRDSRGDDPAAAAKLRASRKCLGSRKGDDLGGVVRIREGADIDAKRRAATVRRAGSVKVASQRRRSGKKHCRHGHANKLSG